jgi:hypothetical protein
MCRLSRLRPVTRRLMRCLLGPSVVPFRRFTLKSFPHKYSAAGIEAEDFHGTLLCFEFANLPGGTSEV